MKRKGQNRGASSSGQPSADYVVGQVSGSLFQQNSAASGSLSGLFSSAAPAAPVLFQPAPKVVPKSVETSKQQKEGPGVRDGAGQQKKKKKPLKERSEADLKLENRESGLQTADDDERGQNVSGKKKRKASELGKERDAEHWVLKRQRLRASKVEEASKTKRTVFVGNLPISCNKKTLRTIFRDKGAIESIRFRSVIREDPAMSRKVAAITRKSHPQRQSINAYVVFKEEEGVTKALERNGLEVEKDFLIRVDRVTDSSSHDHKRSVFVGNLSFEINDLAFRRHFEACGAVEAVRLVRDPTSGLGKGFGYILFENADSVQLALEMDGSQLEGRAVRVKRSVKKEKQKSKPEGKGPPNKASKKLAKGPGGERGAGRGGGFKPPKKFAGNRQKAKGKSSSSFKGEMVDPSKKTKKKGLKKKFKPRKRDLK
ncbi:RNA-binding protein 34 [Cololabis saira]|uniref:RNA-binding protein 34 n=1 Tax=Cololabis saira TaxID=129043 RepID=UPI002AD263CD|nr:RNA-binding protein 34 [Cololabis saira]